MGILYGLIMETIDKVAYISGLFTIILGFIVCILMGLKLLSWLSLLCISLIFFLIVSFILILKKKKK